MRFTNIEAWGFIPEMLSDTNPKPLWEQIDDNYAHGGGWVDFDGFKILSGGESEPFVIQYSGDPKSYEIGRAFSEKECLALFEYSFVLWRNLETGETKIARID